MALSVRRFGTAVAWLAVAVLLLVVVARDPVGAGGTPANKAAANGSKTIVAAPGVNVVLLSKTVKTSAPQDLVLHVTAECSIVTNVETIGNDDQTASGHIEVWVEIDGKPVLVAPGDVDAGKVVFCDRTYRRQTVGFDGDDQGDDTIRTFFSTRSTHGFNWVALNLGSGMHQVVVKATLTATVAGNPVRSSTVAAAVIGNRTLVIDPAHFAHDADLLAS